MLTNILLLFVVFGRLPQIYGYNEERIKSGIKTPPDLFPFIRQTAGCTATIISSRHVLTAAHCYSFFFEVTSKNNDHKRDTYMFYEKIEAEVNIFDPFTKIYFALDRTRYMEHDIAVLEYPESRNLTKNKKPVKLAKDYVEKSGDEAYIVGYGADIEERMIYGSHTLRHTQVTMNEYCFGTLEICGGNSTHLSQPGDSGGPMLIYRNNQWYQIGVCIGGGAFDYRTRVSSYCNFIEEVTKNEVKCESIYLENYLNGQLLPIKHFEPIYKGQSTPLKLFDFVVPLYNYYYNEGCTATVISKRHVLTAAKCVYQYSLKKVNKKLHLTTHSKSYRTLTGKMFPDFRSKNVESSLKNPVDVTAYFPYWYKWPNKHNLAVVEFPEGTDFGVAPILLAKDYGYLPIFMDNETNIVAGYGKYKFTSDMHITESPPLLQHSNDVSKNVYIKYRKIANEKLQRDEGGPTLIERNGKYYQIGVNYFSGTSNGSHTSVSDHCKFIENVTKNEVKCESAVPLYERPHQPTTTTTQAINLPHNQAAAPVIQNQEPSSTAPTMNQLQLTTLLILIFFSL